MPVARAFGVIGFGEVLSVRFGLGDSRSFARRPVPRTLELFPEDRCEGIVQDGAVARLRPMPPAFSLMVAGY